MKKTLITSLILSSSILSTANADTLLGFDAELNMWNPDIEINNQALSDSDVSYTAEVSLEHFIPLIPNAKVAVSNANQGDFSYSKVDYTLYYEFLDNDLISFDLGLGITDLSLDNAQIDSTLVKSIDGVLPNLYAAVEVGIPATPLFVYSKANVAASDSSNVLDFTIGVQYSINLAVIDLELQSGYRIQKMEMDDFDGYTFDSTIDGFFAGVNIDF